MAASPCPPAAPTSIHVALDSKIPGESTALSIKEIGKIFNDSPHALRVAGRKGQHVGLTENIYRSQLQLSFKGVTAADGRALCLYAAQARYTLRYRPKIHVAAELVKKKELYRKVLAHEKEHVAAFLLSANEYLPRVEREMEDFFAGAEGVLIASQKGVDAQKEEIMSQLRAYLEPATDTFKKKDRERQRAIDAPDGAVPTADYNR